LTAWVGSILQLGRQTNQLEGLPKDLALLFCLSLHLNKVLQSLSKTLQVVGGHMEVEGDAGVVARYRQLGMERLGNFSGFDKVGPVDKVLVLEWGQWRRGLQTWVAEVG
jgi:hypothetical protein